jgi:hypothetical protein
MTAPTTSDFLARFPEFGEQSISVVDEALAEAGRFIPALQWGDVHPEAVSYMAAHLLAMRTMQIGNQVGATSGVPTGNRLDATLYGQEYKRLLDSRPLCGFAF